MASETSKRSARETNDRSPMFGSEAHTMDGINNTGMKAVRPCNRAIAAYSTNSTWPQAPRKANRNLCPSSALP